MPCPVLLNTWLQARSKPLSPLTRLRRRHRFYRNLLLLLLVMICLALPQTLRWLGALAYSLTTLLLLLSLEGRSRHGGRGHRLGLPYRLLGLATLLSQWFWYFTPVVERQSGLPVMVLMTVFVAWSLLRLVGYLAEERRINGQVLMGAVAGYLLLGLTAGMLLTVLETVQPGSFSSSQQALGLELPNQLAAENPLQRIWELDFVRLNYFAFATITTVGYGDVLPTTPIAQITSIGFGVIGPFYLALVMGLLISRFTMQDRPDYSNPPAAAAIEAQSAKTGESAPPPP
ncbi:potassium channel family protein [Synechococcus sp. CS-603]|uniref:potassium channel family protein n=1 Tax=Synechococcus sp. CS-603 TaxID=2847981 RepID=UPI00223B6357|nr:potassium channel family protein [Synechococcus sp. CS-603]MCT0201699.1 potassium channel family protein [Synechococcus sp. CS-603]